MNNFYSNSPMKLKRREYFSSRSMKPSYPDTKLDKNVQEQFRPVTLMKIDISIIKMLTN